MESLSIIAGWILAAFIGAAGALVLWKILTNAIKLDKLISEPNGDASLSRFQFLIFTFIVAMSVFLVTLRQDPPKLPDIPAGVLALLGISAGSYVVSKGIQVQRDTRTKQIESNADLQKTTPEAGKASLVATNGAAGVSPITTVVPPAPTSS
jgi:hypothetical protein